MLLLLITRCGKWGILTRPFLTHHGTGCLQPMHVKARRVGDALIQLTPFNLSGLGRVTQLRGGEKGEGWAAVEGGGRRDGDERLRGEKERENERGIKRLHWSNLLAL